MWHAPRPPERGVENARVVRIHREIMGADVFTGEEDLLPGLAAIARAIDSALLIRSMSMAQCRDVHEIRVRRMDTHLADLTRVFQSQVHPGLACIGCLIDAVAVGDVSTEGGLTHAGIAHVGTR